MVPNQLIVVVTLVAGIVIGVVATLIMVKRKRISN